MRKLVTLIFMVLLWTVSSWGQTVLISPTGDGGFENGTTFAANGWTESNSANNPWVVGTYVSTPPFSNRSAYCSNDGGATNSYTTSLAALNYIYRDVVIPAGQTSIVLTFNWTGYGESSYDMIQVFIGPTSIVPVGTTTYPGSGNTNVPSGITGATFVGYLNLQSTIQSVTYYIPGSFAGTTMRLIFAWKDDTSGGTMPGGSIDNISLTSQTPVPLVGTYTIDPAGSGQSNFTTFAAAFTALNLNGVGSGGATFNVADGATFNESLLTLSATGTAANPIIFQKSGSGAKPIVNFTGTSGTTDFGFNLSGCDYVTFNGLEIRDAGTSSSNYTEYGFYLLGGATNGCQYNTIKNCLVDMTKANTSSRGVYLNSIATATSGANTFNKFYNNTIQDSYNGYYFVGNSTYFDDNNEVNTQSSGTSLITNLGNNLSTTLYGIYINYQTNLTIANTTISNVTGASAIYGIYEGSGATNSVNYFNNDINSFTGSSTSSTVYAMYIGTGATHNIYSNQIHGIAAAYTVYGLYVSSGTTNNIYKNSIYDINYNGTSTLIAYGLSIAGGTSNYVYNNYIYDIKAAAATTGNPSVRALNLSGGTNDYVFYNTVYLNYVSTSATNQSAALYVTTTPTLIDLRDNIFINKTNVTTGAYAVAFYRSSSALTNLGAGINNNLYYAGTPGPKNLIHYDLTNSDQTLIAYKARVSPRDGSAVTEDPPFVSNVSPFNLHMQTTIPTQCESGAIPVTSPIGVSTDYDGQARNASTPDIGADEFAGILLDLTSPNITFTPFLNGTVGAHTLTTTITDASGVPTSGIGLPVLYWKINSGAYAPVTAVWVSGSTYNFTFGAGTVLGDIVSYYIVAQDSYSTPNVGASPIGGASGYTANPPACSTPPTTPYTYTVVSSLSGTFTVGTSGNYPSLTGAGGLFADLNSKVIVGNITVQVISDLTEDGTNALNQMAVEPSGSNWTLTIQPGSATMRTISGTYSGGLIRLNGADRVIFDGRFGGGGNYLTFANNVTSGTTSVFQLISTGANAGATYNIIRNCTVRNGYITSGAYGIVAGGSTVGSTGADNDNNTFRENLISKAYVGIWAQGNATSNPGLMDNLQVIGNILGSVTTTEYLGHDGMIFANATGCSIAQNTVYNIIGTNTTPVGITLSTGFVSSSVSRNTINNITYTGTSGYGGRGMYINTGNAASNLTFDNNLIYMIGGDGWSTFSGTSMVGMYFDGIIGGLNIYHNSVYMNYQYTRASVTVTTAILFNSTTITGIDLRNNIFQNSMDNTSQTTDFNYAIYSTAPASSFTNINYNDYYANGPQGVLGYLGSNQITLGAWQAVTLQDANSKNIDPLFTSNTDLHASASGLDNQGVFISAVPLDFTGISRTNPPDMGAYEFGTNPTLNTLAATGIDCYGGTLNGTINANGLTVNSFFDYGLTTAYGSSVPGTPATVTGSSTTPVTGLITMPAATTYHFRIRGVTSTGVTSYGPDMTLTTLATGAPLATTLIATTITDNSAILHGIVNGLCNPTVVVFEYGLTTSYGSNITADQSPVTGFTDVAVSVNLTGLTLNTTYHYRVKATSSAGTSYGGDIVFTTGANPPIVLTNAATNVGNFTARLNGTVTASNQNSNVTFQYGLTNSYGSTVAGVPAVVSGNTPTAVYADVSNLAYNTTYHFRCVGQNPAGTTYGGDQVFTTLCPVPDPAGTITGPTSLCQATSGHVYTVPPINYAYTGYVWTVPTGGTITGGAGTNSITVSYSASAVSGDVTVYGTSICGNGAPSSLAVTVNPLPVPVINGPNVGCITHNYTYSTTAGMSGYTWTVSAGGQIMSGAGTNSINVKWNSAGAQWVSLTYTSQFGCPAAAPTIKNVTVGNLTSPTIAGSDLMCANSGYFVYTTQQGYSNYVWTVTSGGTIVSGQGTYQVEVNWTSGGAQSVSVNYANEYGCSASTPTSFGVTVMAVPGNAGPVQGPHDVCAGETNVSYDTPPIQNADNYIWTLPAGATIVDGANTRHIKVDFAADAQSGQIKVHGENMCGVGQESQPLNLTVNGLPATPVASVDEFFVLHSDAAEGNQWYLDGTMIDGANGQDYQAEVEGTYWTIVTNDCGSAESNHVEVIFTGIGEQDGPGFSIYPVPNNGKFVASIISSGEKNYTITVFNDLGMKMYERTDIRVNGKFQQSIDLNNPATGVYTVVLQGDDHTVIRKILVTR
jgi:hypothetical protein